MNQVFSLKKSLLITVIAALCVSALLGIIVFLLGNFGEIEFKILMTTLAIGGYSLTGLCCAILLEKGKYKKFAISGMLISLVTLFYSVLVIWSIFDFMDDYISKLLAVLLILAFSTAHSSLMLLISSKKIQVSMSAQSTIIFITIVAAMIIFLVLGNYSPGDFFFRLLGVFAILDALGTIVTPILNKVYPTEGLPQS